MGRISDLLVSLIFFMLILFEGGWKMFGWSSRQGWKAHLGLILVMIDMWKWEDVVRYDPFSRNDVLETSRFKSEMVPLQCSRLRKMLPYSLIFAQPAEDLQDPAIPLHVTRGQVALVKIKVIQISKGRVMFN